MPDTSVEVKNVALIPIIIVIANFLLSPDFYNLLPDKYSHIISVLAIVASTLLPSLFKKKINVEEQQKDS